ncbi:MAG: helix-turn-helix transcriptional regulator [Candidatus Aminicenantes bacterium]|nr:helix-turn-helix transcriptional regulator [Candidatus Aminicenantes bacterium]
MIKKNELGSRIKEARKALNLMQKDFAETLAISAPALSDIETGKNWPGLEILEKMVKKYNIDIYYVLFGEGDMFIDPVFFSFRNFNEMGVRGEDVRDFLEYFAKSRLVQFAVMQAFRELLFAKKDLIESELNNMGKDEE